MKVVCKHAYFKRLSDIGQYLLDTCCIAQVLIVEVVGPGTFDYLVIYICDIHNIGHVVVEVLGHHSAKDIK